MMTVSEKLRAIAEMVEENENSFDYYSKQSTDENNRESMREYYAYKAELYKAQKDALLSKVSKL